MVFQIKMFLDNVRDFALMPVSLGAAVIDLIGGQIQLMVASAPSVASQIKSGKLRALAVTSTEPSALAPGLPTVAASGVPGYEMVTVMAMLAPAGTPGPVSVVARHRDALQARRLLRDELLAWRSARVRSESPTGGA